MIVPRTALGRHLVFAARLHTGDCGTTCGATSLVIYYGPRRVCAYAVESSESRQVRVIPGMTRN